MVTYAFPALPAAANRWAGRLAIFTGVGAFMGATGGFGTYLEAPLINRLAGWIAEFWVGLLLYVPAVNLAVRWGGRRGWPIWIIVPLTVFAVSLLMTPLSYLLSAWLMGARQQQSALSRYGDVLLVSLPVVCGYAALQIRLRQTPAVAEAPAREAAPRPVRFLERLPPRLGRELLCLEMEDHYVRAHTLAGSDLILMRMRDAVAELDGLPGLQVHRSWWVAEAAVAGHRRSGRQLSLTLKNGLEAPVARSAEPAVKTAGWLDLR